MKERKRVGRTVRRSYWTSTFPTIELSSKRQPCRWVEKSQRRASQPRAYTRVTMIAFVRL